MSMPSLKLHGPKRPGEPNSQQLSPTLSSVSGGSNKKTKRVTSKLSTVSPSHRQSSSIGDAIQVSHKPSVTPTATSDEGEEPSFVTSIKKKSTVLGQPPMARTDHHPIISGAPTTNRPWGRKGKAPVREGNPTPSSNAGILDSDEVEEYHFSDEEGQDQDGEDMDLSDETNQLEDVPNSDPSIISISDDELPSDERRTRDNDGVAIFDADARPWKDFNPDQRKHWEMMYCHIQDRPLYGSWDSTESYQRQKDEEMSLYIEDYPIEDWVVPRKAASDAFEGMFQRQKWRNLGIRIYQQGVITDVIGGPNAMSAPYQRSGAQQALRGPPPQPGSVPPHLGTNHPHGQNVSQVPHSRMLASQPTAQPVARLPNGQPMPNQVSRTPDADKIPDQNSHISIESSPPE